MWRGGLIAAAAMLFSAFSAGAETYRYTDGSGNIGLTDDYWSIPEAQRESATLITEEHIKSLESQSVVSSMGKYSYKYLDNYGNTIITNDRESIPPEFADSAVLISTGTTDASKLPWTAKNASAIGATFGRLQDLSKAYAKNALGLLKAKSEFLKKPLFWLPVSGFLCIMAFAFSYSRLKARREARAREEAFERFKYGRKRDIR